MGLNDAIVEKDFWVCFTLDYLFHRCPWKDSITFKGGISLSKAFNLINRFSEDIDLILDWRVLGYEKHEPWEKRSNTKQDVHFGKRQQYFIMRPTDRSIWICHNDIQDITMTFIEWLRLR